MRSAVISLVFAAALGCSTNTEDTEGEPRAGGWTEIAAMPLPTQGACATVLKDGRVLVAGGAVHEGGEVLFLRETKLYDPATDVWAEGPPMNHSHAFSTCVRLPKGEVVVVGDGHDQSAVALRYVRAGRQIAEIYDPTTNAWRLTSNSLSTDPGRAVAALPDGRILAAGGSRRDEAGELVPSSACELFNPDTEEWTALPVMPRAAGHYAAAMVLSGERVVVFDPETRATDVIDLRIRTWSEAPAGRSSQTGLPVVAGSRLVGPVDGSFAVSCYRRLPAGLDTTTLHWTPFTARASGFAPLCAHGLGVLGDGRVVVVDHADSAIISGTGAYAWLANPPDDSTSQYQGPLIVLPDDTVLLFGHRRSARLNLLLIDSAARARRANWAT